MLTLSLLKIYSGIILGSNIILCIVKISIELKTSTKHNLYENFTTKQLTRVNVLLVCEKTLCGMSVKCEIVCSYVVYVVFISLK